MTSSSRHPSYLELDRHALGAQREAGTAGHVASCTRCRSYVERVTPAEQAADVPAWLCNLAESAPPRTGLRLRVPLALTGALALAAGVCLTWWSAQSALDRPPAYDTAKGLPAVAVYVNHSGNVSLWAGAALAPRDSIRLEVAAEDFVHVSVFVDSHSQAGHGRQLLYQGHVTAHARELLPKAWQLDDAELPEHISVLFSTNAITPAHAVELLTAETLDPAHAYLVQVTLPKRRE